MIGVFFLKTDAAFLYKYVLIIIIIIIVIVVIVIVVNQEQTTPVVSSIVCLPVCLETTN